ncbi:MAG: CDP-glycerol glycerophosphotransferase family protein, partial [Candidatus Aenigmarchaeota archaeon]|nr:CDP-glycerol glycerophosphotransferase family protein [Candidatus Aenigmarchaeota archaeon]
HKVSIICENKEFYKPYGKEFVYELDEFTPQPFFPKLLELENEVNRGWYSKVLDSSISFKGYSLAEILYIDFFDQIINPVLVKFIKLKFLLEKMQPEVVIIFGRGYQSKILKHLCLRMNIKVYNLAEKWFIDNIWFPLLEKAYPYILPIFVLIAFVFLIIITLYDMLIIGNNQKENRSKDKIVIFTPHEENFLRRAQSLAKLDRDRVYFMLMLPFCRWKVYKCSILQKLIGPDIKYGFVSSSTRDLLPIIKNSISLYMLIFKKILKLPRIKLVSYDIYLPISHLVYKLLLFFSIHCLLKAVCHIQIGYRFLTIVSKKVVFINANLAKARALNLVFKKNGITTYQLQHGMIEAISGYRTNVVKNLAWSNFDAKLLKQFSNDDIVIPNCYPHYEVIKTKLKKFDGKYYRLSDRKKKIVIFTSPISWEMRYVKRYINTVLNAITNFNHIDVVIKIHPAENIKWYAQLLQKQSMHFSIIKDANIFDLFEKADVIITPYSSVIVEALFFKKPILIFSIPIYDKSTLFGYINPERVFSDSDDLIVKMTQLLNGNTFTYNVDLTPENQLFETYFGHNVPFINLSDFILQDE